jgi:hypothetical protein
VRHGHPAKAQGTKEALSNSWSVLVAIGIGADRRVGDCAVKSLPDER